MYNSAYSTAERTAVPPITMTVAMAAEYTSLSRPTLWRLLRDGKLTRVRVGTRTLVRRQELDNWLLG